MVLRGESGVLRIVPLRHGGREARGAEGEGHSNLSCAARTGGGGRAWAQGVAA